MTPDQPATDRSSPRPVILGAGLTGLAISQALSAAGISHVLVGDRPTRTPRLGESLNAEGSLEIVRQFPGYARFFVPKRRQVLFFGGHALAVDFTGLVSGRVQDALLGHPRTVEFLHVDRVGFDAALFDAAIADIHCTFVEGRAASLDYRSSSDRIDGVVLNGGRHLAASHVFDATNQVRFVARKLGVPRTVIGPRRRVIFAHYRKAALSAPASSTPARTSPREAFRLVRRLAEEWGVACSGGDRTGQPPKAEETAQQRSAPPWLQATSLLRLDSRTDALEGLAWCIPLGDYVSVGISVDPATVTTAPAPLLDRVERAYALRGIDVRGAFPERGTPLDFPYEHYNHERCYGRNWLLTGPTCCQFWFPSAAGVATGLIAARLAPELLRSPRETAALYQDYIDRQAAAHGGLNWLTRDDPWAATGENLGKKAQTMVVGNIQRLGRYLGLRPASPELAFGDALAKWYQTDRVQANPWRIAAAPPEAQAVALFPGSGESVGPAVGGGRLTRAGHPEGPKAILGLADVLSGRRAPESGRSLVTPDLRLHVGEFTLRGFQHWNAWVSLLRGSRRVANLELVPGPLAAAGDRWVLTCQWQGTRNGVAAFSPQFSVSFALSGGQVAEILTRRADHAFVLGDSVLSRVGFAAVLGLFGENVAA